MGGAVEVWIESTLMQATITSDDFTGLAGTPENKNFIIIILGIMHNLPYIFEHSFFIFFHGPYSAPLGKTSCDNNLSLATEENPGAGCNVPQPNNTAFKGQTFP